MAEWGAVGDIIIEGVHSVETWEPSSMSGKNCGDMRDIIIEGGFIVEPWEPS